MLAQFSALFIVAWFPMMYHSLSHVFTPQNSLLNPSTMCEYIYHKLESKKQQRKYIFLVSINDTEIINIFTDLLKDRTEDTYSKVLP